jgi:signal peptidase II
MLGLLIFGIRKSRELSLWKLFFITLIVSGGLGNIFDRLLYDRHVTDFMNIGLGTLRTGIFNFADVYVTFGMLAILLFFNHEKASPVEVN